MTTHLESTAREEAGALRRGNGPGGGALRLWLIAFAGFFLLSAGWALATPYDGTPDEMQHVIRAAGVARGQVAPKPVAADTGTGAFQDVPGTLVRKNCWAFTASRTPACGREPGGGDREAQKTATRAGRYNPVYYAAVGLPLVVTPDWKGILGARLISAALVSALLAAAVIAVVCWSRQRLLLGGVLVAATPMTLHMAGAINPSGLEIAAGLALFAALVPLLMSDDPGPAEAADHRRLWVLAGVAAVVLTTLRALGPLWLAVTVGILLVPSGRSVITRLWATRTARLAVAAAVVATVLALVWTVVMRTTQLGQVENRPELTLGEALRYEVMHRWANYIAEMVGVTSWLDTRPPGLVYVLWYMAFGLLVLGALALGRGVDRWRLIGLAFAALAIPTLSDAVNVNKYGFVAQGRYMLPLTVGLPIIAAYVLARRDVLAPGATTSVVRALAVVLMPIQLVFLTWTMIRWQSGIAVWPKVTTLNPLAGSWHPPLGSALPLACAVAGAATLVALTWTSTRPARD